MFSDRRENQSAFTIVELLVVIVIIGILAAITIVSYTGITQKAVSASIASDLENASKQLKLFQVTTGNFPTTIDCSKPESATNLCIKASSGNAYNYVPNLSANPQTFGLTETNTNGTVYLATNDSTPAVIPSACPTGFIQVPGSTTYNTSSFCVMKYEAKNAGSNVPVSQVAGSPWVDITQTNAIAYSPNVAGCTGCHLVTEAEWMTLAQNIMSVASNWSGGLVGSGYVYSGHSDNAPGSSLAADASDANGYAGETNTGGNQKRTLKLTNGQVIWDFTGNVWEWTSGQVSGGQPGIVGNNFGSFVEWPSVTVPGSLPVNPLPSGTGLAGAGTWSSANGMGRLLSSTTDNGLYAFYRGGGWVSGTDGGIAALVLSGVPSDSNSYRGFRVAR